MGKSVKIGMSSVGDGEPTYIVGEIGINHNGVIDLAKKLIDVAVTSGCNAVKFQKRTPELCVPEDQRNRMRQTPWGYITYMEYREKIEFGFEEFNEIDRYCRERNIDWFASCWDVEAVKFIEQYDVPCYKISSASLTDRGLLKALRNTGKPLVISSGMSTIEQIRGAVDFLGIDDLIILHCTSTYPCPVEELNLKMITTLKNEFDCPVGYSGHEIGLWPTVATVALGASFIERHITLDRAIWGSDQASSVEPQGLQKLVRTIRTIEGAMGDGIKKVYASEEPIIARLRIK
jgi:N-acetylneuraminate synthase